MKLIGLAELAELYGVSKNTANTWARRHDWPSPVVTLKMGPVWDRDKILRHKPLDDSRKMPVSDEFGFFTIRVQTPPCSNCSCATEPEEGSLQVGSDACGDVTIQYTIKCPNCGGETWPYFDYPTIQREARP